MKYIVDISEDDFSDIIENGFTNSDQRNRIVYAICHASYAKTGYWFVDERPESDREVICSNCEQPIFKYHKINFDYRPKYCPNCGAKMESENEE